MSQISTSLVGGEAGGLTIGSTSVTGGTVGSVLFIGASTKVQQDNSNFYFDDSNNTLGLGTTRSGAQSSSNPVLRIKAGSAGAMQLELQDSTGATALQFTSTVSAGSISLSNSTSLGISTAGNTTIFIQPGGNTVASFNTGTGNALVLQSYADAITLQCKAFSGQTANLQNWTNSSGTVLSSVSSAGRFLAPNGTSSTASYQVGQTNTGMYLYTTNTPALVGGGGNTGLVVLGNNSLQMGVQWGGVAAVLNVVDAGSGVTDRTGTSLTIRPGAGSGAGTGADLIFQTPDILGSGTTAQSSTEKFRIKNTNGALSCLSTITTPGTTGNQTINKPAGRVNIAAGGTTITVTNSCVTANSIIFAVAATADATARVTNVVPGSGSFVINTVACTSETAFNFFVIS